MAAAPPAYMVAAPPPSGYSYTSSEAVPQSVYAPQLRGGAVYSVVPPYGQQVPVNMAGSSQAPTSTPMLPLQNYPQQHYYVMPVAQPTPSAYQQPMYGVAAGPHLGSHVPVVTLQHPTGLESLPQGSLAAAPDAQMGRPIGEPLLKQTRDGKMAPVHTAVPRGKRVGQRRPKYTRTAGAIGEPLISEAMMREFESQGSKRAKTVCKP